jgi:hypothetical protein
MPVPSYVTYYILIASVGILAVLLWGLRQAVERTGWNEAERRATLHTASALFVIWFALALTLAWADFFRGQTIPTIQFGVFVPIAVAAVFLWRSTRVRQLIDAIPQSWLVGFQFYRVLGLIFLVLLSEDRLPSAFAAPAGSGDVAIGLLAIPLAYAYARGVPGRDWLVGAWNVLGLLDLIVAITTGFLSSPSPFQLLALDAPNELISAFPLVMVPIFGVPLAVMLHLASLAKLSRRSVRMIAPLAA